ncbi:hypothetical protein BGZ79_007636 [Entomortierella chlamydospora]|nr:hypothetical protein BGZ79_007636 [Entomortierella chlamydospora]
MTLSAKAQAIERDFQNARGKANYAAFPEFVRRYLKHNKDGIVLAYSALLEMAIGEAELKAQKIEKWSYLASLDDTPQSIAVSPRVKPESIQDAIQKLESVLSKGTDEHQEGAAIVLARAAMATDAPDRLQRVAHYLQNIQLPPVKLPSGYGFTLVVCGLTIKGIAFEEEDRISEAIVCYDHVSNLVQSNPHEKCEELSSWTEHALYRAGMLKLRQGDQLAAIRSFKAYHSQAVSWPSEFRAARRVTLYQYFSQALSTSFKAYTATNGTSTVIDEQSQFYPTALSQELAQIHAYWEDSLATITSFPKADEKNWRVLVMIEQIVEDRKLLGSGSDADKRALVETIYRASQKTFQSPRILRFLFFALLDLGQFDEAELALEGYLGMMQIKEESKDTVEEVLTHEQRVRQDIESEYDITTVMIAGSLLYGKELGKHIEALACADKALSYINKYLQQHESLAELLYSAYNHQGIAYGLQASNAHDPEKRPALYAKAIDSFTRSIEALPDAFEGHYLLALQLAEMREVPRAILSVKQSLGINPSHIPSWHLLVLLLSSQKDYERALDICSVGLRESEWDNPQTDGFTASQIDGEDYLALRVTQIALQDQINGPESSLELQEALFGLYNKVFATEPSALIENMYDVQSIRRRETTDSEVPSGSTVTGRPRASSILSSRSKAGTGSDISQAPNIGTLNSLEVPKANYASSITSSIGSTGSKIRRHATPVPVQQQAPLSRSGLSLPPTVQRATTKSILRTARANKTLISLWLLSASTFRRLGRFEDAMKSIEEAERVDPSNPDVWYQLGLLYSAQEDQESASVSFSKALALSPHHPACLTRLARSYLEAGSLEMAEGILETTTKSLGWDSAEAWFYLGKIFEESDRLTRAKECLWYALELESSRPIRGFVESVPRYLA